MLHRSRWWLKRELGDMKAHPRTYPGKKSWIFRIWPPKLNICCSYTYLNSRIQDATTRCVWIDKYDNYEVWKAQQWRIDCQKALKLFFRCCSLSGIAVHFGKRVNVGSTYVNFHFCDKPWFWRALKKLKHMLALLSEELHGTIAMCCSLLFWRSNWPWNLHNEHQKY